MKKEKVNWIKKFIVNVILENLTIATTVDGQPRLEWKIKKEI